MHLFTLASAAFDECTALYPQFYTCFSRDFCNVGERINATCEVSSRATCLGDREMTKQVKCVYCWQLPQSDFNCEFPDECIPTSRPQIGKCTVYTSVECLGPRTFYANIYCTATAGYSIWTALILSFFFGGFGADRFYMGYTKLGFLKLFTFGGFGIWSVIDFILISSGSLRPMNYYFS